MNFEEEVTLYKWLKKRFPDLKEMLEDFYVNQHLTMAQIAKKMDASPMTICRQLHKFGIPTRTDWATIHPNLEPSRALAYILGVLKGDGCVSKFRGGRTFQYQVILQVKSKPFTFAFKTALRKIGLHPKLDQVKQRHPQYKGRRMYRVIGRSIIFYNWYYSLSLEDIENMLLTKTFVKSFIKGFYESEGYSLKAKDKHYNYFRYKIAMYNTDYMLLQLIKKLLQRLGFYFRLYPMKKSFSQLATSNKQRFELVASGKTTFKNFFEAIKPICKLPNTRV